MNELWCHVYARMWLWDVTAGRFTSLPRNESVVASTGIPRSGCKSCRYKSEQLSLNVVRKMILVGGVFCERNLKFVMSLSHLRVTVFNME